MKKTPAASVTAKPANTTTVKPKQAAFKSLLPTAVVIAVIAIIAWAVNGRLTATAKPAPAPATATTVATTAPVATATAPVATKEESVIRDGIRESLKTKFGVAHQTVDKKATPVVKWESEEADPNLNFPVDGTEGAPPNTIITGGEEEPPQFVDPKAGYTWVRLKDPKAVPARWRGVVAQMGYVWATVPAQLVKK